EESTRSFVEGVTAIEREVELRRRNAAKDKKGKLKKYQQERDKLGKRLETALAKEEAHRRHSQYVPAHLRGPAPRLSSEKVRAQIAELDKKHLGLTEREC
ncbi:MAG TPA: hypothetical protein VNV44_13785, partial [Solirubrobacteraceae bacterium]|nr:hypothetical protein [Solirubrobacteraceae bacterium]